MHTNKTGAFGLALAFLPVLLAQTFPIDSVSGLTTIQVKAEADMFKGRKAVRITDAAPPTTGDAGRLALVSGTQFQDGVIEIDMAGDVMPGAAQGARGFVGMVFRAAPDASKFECFYLRPTNPRSDDQVRRNHSVQYISIPGFPWQLLREKFPEKYESYVDLVPGEWTKVKVAAKADHAQLFVNGVDQPSLIVNDLKQPVSSGQIGLWIGPGTVAHFTNLRVTKE
jgi:hypothetical protein